MASLLSVEKALATILEGVASSPSEHVSLVSCLDRTLAEDVVAKRTQPPFPASAMDGYAAHAADLSSIPATLNMIGESAAGHGFNGSIGQGECVRIFTGAPVPEGADTIIIQENVEANGNAITVLRPERPGRYIRPAGMDFTEGDQLLANGTVLDPTALSLAAAMNHPTLPVHAKPRVAIIASGDELLLPGAKPGPDQIISSNSFGVSAIVERAGGEPMDLGIAVDTLEALDAKFEAAKDADIVVTLGGASVGDHDLVHEAMRNRGVSFEFWQLAMRPGKPVMFGTAVQEARTVRYIGLPGNPVSSLVGAMVFVVPLIRKHLGLDASDHRQTAKLAIDLPENDKREEYMRAVCRTDGTTTWVEPFAVQDSSVLSLMVKANCLMIRPAHAPAANKGDACEIIPI